MKVSEVIEKLKTMPQDMEVYIDCFHCGASQSLKVLDTIVIALTEKPAL